MTKKLIFLLFLCIFLIGGTAAASPFVDDFTGYYGNYIKNTKEKRQA